ncbi:MAG: hypothetical protein RBT35_08085 [Bacteroidales bacterium]|jgi:hypothetical protein|nr:hypothetical protein [Bacteroidales bacterium]
MIRQGFIALALASIVALLLALPDWMPYGYFEFLRWLVCITAIMVALRANTLNKPVIVVLAVLVAILFNPIAMIHLGKKYWLFLDPLTALFFATSIYVFELKRKVH